MEGLHLLPLAQHNHVGPLRPACEGPQEIRLQEGHIAADGQGQLVGRRLQPCVQPAQHAHTPEAVLDQPGVQPGVGLHVACHDQHLGAHVGHPLDDVCDQRPPPQVQEGLVAPHPPAGPTRQHDPGQTIATEFSAHLEPGVLASLVSGVPPSVCSTVQVTPAHNGAPWPSLPPLPADQPSRAAICQRRQETQQFGATA